MRRQRDRTGENGLTLLEVVIALLLFAMIAMFLLDGHSRAADAVLRMQVERDMAELLRLRLDLAALEHEEYREGTTEGTFPATVSRRIVDEEKVLGSRYPGYRWEVTITAALGAGASGRVEVQDDRTYEPLFGEEGSVPASTDKGTTTGTDKGTEEETSVMQAEDIDRMLLIEVTVFPPGYDPLNPDGNGLQPRSAWTAVYLPPDEADATGGNG
ncbi:MAG TPA: prepilin-type N-terminal cleavage/methylation domain-containing protein [Planctomycetota bacterium]|nr:prepilin-type N-terminal cleavage/methylation domain-containing protein [Planctomycetota bacterium]